jgi:hypothetical protein
MTRWLIIIGVVLLLAGIFWPLIEKSGIGRLPGDIVVRRPHFSFYFPLATSLLLSLFLTGLFWLLRR